MKPDLLFGRDVLPEASQRKLLFESAQLPVQFWLEQLPCAARVERLSRGRREEILLIQGDLNWNHNIYSDVYLCLTPDQSVPQFSVGNAGAVLLRIFFGSAPESNHGPGADAQGQPPVEVVDFWQLAWNEIPARRANDPGARIVELSTNASRTRITSLMDCRPGWILDDHDHPSDVLTFCVRGGGILGIEEATIAYEAGHLVAIPAGRRHRFQTGKEGALLAVFVFEPFLARGY